jgi:hypothetical protein
VERPGAHVHVFHGEEHVAHALVARGDIPPQKGEPTAVDCNSTTSSTMKRVREAIAVVRAAQTRTNFPKRARLPPAPPPCPPPLWVS